MNDRLEALAAELEENGDYKVQRRLKPRSKLDLADGSPRHLGILLDTETTGLDPTIDEVIELAMVPFVFTSDGLIVEVLPAFDQLRQPAKPIPPTITKLTGITDAMVAGRTVDTGEVKTFMAQAEWIVSHHSRFDRPFAERLFPGFAEKRWGCSMTQVPWSEAGVEGCKLAYLLNACGFFHDGHRALDDCHAAVEILARPLGETGRTALAFLLETAARTTQRIWATGAPYEVKDRLRARSYRWNAGTDGRPRAWYVDADEAQHEAEIAFLRDEVFGRDWHPLVTRIGAYDRFSDRG